MRKNKKLANQISRSITKQHTSHPVKVKWALGCALLWCSTCRTTLTTWKTK